MQEKRGITLLALVITVIIMLILVAVTMNIFINKRMLFQTKEAKRQTEQSALEEELSLNLVDLIDSDLKNIEEEELKSILSEKLNGEINNIVKGPYEGIKTNDLKRNEDVFYFNYKKAEKTYGIELNVKNLQIKVMDNPIIYYELVTSNDQLEIGKKYIITSEILKIGQNIDVVRVLDGQEDDGDVVKNRKCTTYDELGGDIAYIGDYGLILEGEEENYEFYDNKNKQYLSTTEAREYNQLTIGESSDYSKLSINIDELTGEAVIKFYNKDVRNYIRSNNWYMSSYEDISQEPVYLYKEIGYNLSDRLETPKVVGTFEEEKVVLEWQEIENASSYRIQFFDSDKREITAKIEISDTNRYVREKLKLGSTYYYKVKALSDNENIKDSNWSTLQRIVLANGTYKMITKEEDLVSGARYMISTTNKTTETAKIMANTNTSSRMDATVTSIFNEEISNPNGENVFEFKKNGEYWTIKNTDGKYLSGANGKLSLSDKINNNTKFIITFEEGKVFIKCLALTERYIYLNPAVGFGCYQISSGYSDNYLFKEY